MQVPCKINFHLPYNFRLQDFNCILQSFVKQIAKCILVLEKSSEVLPTSDNSNHLPQMLSCRY